MKIISGYLKGKNIELPDKKITRPTMNRIKESLFATIDSNLKEAVVLDLFGGSGALSFESISNGASKAYIIDNNSKVISIINKNINNLKLNDKVILINEDAHIQLKKFCKQNIKFDIIFIDPPYIENIIEDLVNQIINLDLLKKNGLIICEHENKMNINTDIFILKEKKYGSKHITILYKCID